MSLLPKSFFLRTIRPRQFHVLLRGTNPDVQMCSCTRLHGHILLPHLQTFLCSHIDRVWYCTTHLYFSSLHTSQVSSKQSGLYRFQHAISHGQPTINWHYTTCVHSLFCAFFFLLRHFNRDTTITLIKLIKTCRNWRNVPLTNNDKIIPKKS